MDLDSQLLDACRMEESSLKDVKRLVEAGANIEAKLSRGSDSNFAGATPLILACNEHFLDKILYLIERGANVNATNNNGDKTPLTSATQKTYAIDPPTKMNILTNLIQAGANINYKTRYGGHTILSIVCTYFYNYNIEIVQLFLEPPPPAVPADPNILNNFGKTTLDHINKDYSPALYAFLRMHGALTSNEIKLRNARIGLTVLSHQVPLYKKEIGVERAAGNGTPFIKLPAPVQGIVGKFLNVLPSEPRALAAAVGPRISQNTAKEAANKTGIPWVARKPTAQNNVRRWLGPKASVHCHICNHDHPPNGTPCPVCGHTWRLGGRRRKTAKKSKRRSRKN
jgi:hypothetical protein